MGSKSDIGRYLVNLEDERNSARLYRALAECEADPKISEVYRRLAETEESHAGLWGRMLREAGGEVPPFRPSMRTRILVWLARRFGTSAILPAVSSRELTASQEYAGQPEAVEMTATERSHARILNQVGRSGRGGMGGSALAQIEGRHRLAGVNPEDLGGSAWEAAFTSFALFAAGAVIPVIPFVFLGGTAAIAASAAASAAGLFFVGAAITLFTGRPVWHSGLRQVFFGLVAAAATFFIGRLVGISLGG